MFEDHASLNEIPFEDDPDLPPPPYIESENNKFVCILCNIPTLNCCSECQQVFYCSAYHQKLHWKIHQSECANSFAPKPLNHQLSNESNLSKILPHQISSDLKSFLHPNTVYSNNNNNISLNNNASNTNKEKSPKKSLEKMDRDNISNVKIDDLRIDKLLSERDKERKEILIMFSQGQFSQALTHSKRLSNISKKIMENNNNTINNKKNDLRDFFDYCSDHLLRVKSLLKNDKIAQARESLLLLMPLVDANIDDQKIDYQKLKESDKLNENTLKDIKISNDIDDNITFQKRFLLNNELKKRTNLLSVLASLFYAVGDYKNCEGIYVKYIRLVENNYGKDSLEISNCYFLIGVFYLQHKFYTKALACFKKTLEMRLTKLGEKHESIADCWYNMGIVYKQTDERFKAIQYLEKAHTLRKELIGEISLACAQALETLGKIFLESSDYKAAYLKFQDCYYIRKKILNNSKHPDLIRISLLILHLQTTIKEDVNLTANKKNQDILLSVNEQIMKSNLEKSDSNLNCNNTFHKTLFSEKKETSLNKTHLNDSISSKSRAISKFGAQNKLNEVNQLFSPKKEEDSDEEEKVFLSKNKNEKNQKNEKKKNNFIFDLKVDKDFLASLSTDQLMKLAALKTLIKENQTKMKEKYDPNADIMNSDFIRSLNGVQYGIFVQNVKNDIEEFIENRSKEIFDNCSS